MTSTPKTPLPSLPNELIEKIIIHRLDDHLSSIIEVLIKFAARRTNKKLKAVREAYTTLLWGMVTQMSALAAASHTCRRIVVDKAIPEAISFLQEHKTTIESEVALYGQVKRILGVEIHADNFTKDEGYMMREMSIFSLDLCLKHLRKIQAALRRIFGELPDNTSSANVETVWIPWKAYL